MRAVVEDFEEDEAPLQAEIEKRLAASVCKRMAVKAGQALSPEEQRALLDDLEACELAAYLPARASHDDPSVRGNAGAAIWPPRGALAHGTAAMLRIKPDHHAC